MILTIIIPVYNTEKFLEKCLNSILSQNLSTEDYEVLIINDGSPDHSHEIISDFIKKRSNFKYFRKENGGLSSARNFGLDNARGDYVFFVDSDDYLYPNSLSKILDIIKKNTPDVVSFNYKRVTDDNQILSTNMYYKEEGIVSGAYILNNYTIVSNVWRYFFNKSIIDANSLRFTEKIYHEDEDFTTIYLSFCNKVIHSKQVVYAYLQREGSIMNTKDLKTKEKKINDLIIVINNIHKRRLNTEGDLYNGLSKKIEQLLISIFIRMKSEGFEFSKSQEIVSKLNNLEFFPLKINHQKIKFKIAATLFNNKLFRRLFYK